MEEFIDMKPLLNDVNETITFHIKKMLRNQMDEYSDLKNNMERIMQIPIVRRIQDLNDKLNTENASLKKQLDSISTQEVCDEKTMEENKKLVMENQSLREEMNKLSQTFSARIKELEEQNDKLSKDIESRNITMDIIEDDEEPDNEQDEEQDDEEQDDDDQTKDDVVKKIFKEEENDLVKQVDSINIDGEIELVEMHSSDKQTSKQSLKRENGNLSLPSYGKEGPQSDEEVEETEEEVVEETEEEEVEETEEEEVEEVEETEEEVEEVEETEEEVVEETEEEVVEETEEEVVEETEEEVVEETEEEEVEETEEEEVEEADCASDDEGLEVFELEIKGATYYVTDDNDSPVYECLEDGDVGDEIGTLKSGKLFLN